MKTCRRHYSEVQPGCEIGNKVLISLMNNDGNPSPLPRLRPETLTCSGTKIRHHGNIASIEGQVSASIDIRQYNQLAPSRRCTPLMIRVSWPFNRRNDRFEVVICERFSQNPSREIKYSSGNFFSGNSNPCQRFFSTQ